MVKDVITPNVIIAGVTKAGTTSLFTYLSDHPEICGSTIKEISHFLTVRFREPAHPIENYSRYFAHCRHQRYRLEASPAYFFGGRELAETVYRALPAVRAILVLREPVSRCLSHFKFCKNMLWLPKEMQLDEYFEICQGTPYESFRERGSHVYYGLASGIYSNYIDGWIETFGGNLHICFFEDLMRDSWEFTRSICRWLELDDECYDDYEFVLENKGRGYSSPLFQNWALKLNKSFEGFFRKHIAIKRILRDLYFAINGARKRTYDIRADDDTVARIREYYVPHNGVLREQLLKAGVKRVPDWLREAE